MLYRFCFLFLFLAFLPHTALWAATYVADDDIIGEVLHYKVKKNDNLHEIARRFDMGIVRLLAANPGVTPKTLKAGSYLTIPAAHILPDVRNGIVLNLAEQRLFYFTDTGEVMTFPVGIGREGWLTPTGSTIIARKRENPTWTPPESIREENPDLPDIIPAGPQNPLGEYALNLGMPGYLIHGTNSPNSIGKRASHGCIRLYPEDIKALFATVTEGTSVVIMDTPYKLGWRGNTLFLEITPTQYQSDAIAKYQTAIPEIMMGIGDVIQHVAAENKASIDWRAVKKTIAEHSGIPAAIAIRP